jgi:hypothetical protein
MMMRGDLNKLVEQINPILEGYDKRLKALEEAIKYQKKPPSTKKDIKDK